LGCPVAGRSDGQTERGKVGRNVLLERSQDGQVVRAESRSVGRAARWNGVSDVGQQDRPGGVVAALPGHQVQKEVARLCG